MFRERLEGFESRPGLKRPAVVWEKFKAMRAGADLATQQLWS